MDSLNAAKDDQQSKRDTVSVSIGWRRISLLLNGGSDPVI